MKHSTAKDIKKKQKQEEAIKQAHKSYIDKAMIYVKKCSLTIDILKRYKINSSVLELLETYITHAERQIDHIQRRVIDGEKIPHDEKVFSIFEPHTEWISKGKAGVPVELGLKICVLEDQYGFVLHHKVMEHLSDNEVAISIIKEALKRFPDLYSCSFDKGFHSPLNQEKLKELLEHVVLPKKGRRSQSEFNRENAEEFIKAKNAHSAVESCINALEVHGLDKCPDHGIDGFKLYTALAVVARNIQKLGALKQKSIIKSNRAVRTKLIA